MEVRGGPQYFNRLINPPPIYISPSLNTLSHMAYSNMLKATRTLESSPRLYIFFPETKLIVQGAKKLFMMIIKEVKTLTVLLYMPRSTERPSLTT